MAELAEGEEKGTNLGPQAEKPRVVRVKRKREQTPIEALWLEVSGRPSKRQEPDISTLTVSTPSASLLPPDEEIPTKLFFRRLETISPSGLKESSLLASLLQKVNDKKQTWEGRKEQQEGRAKSKEKQGQLLAAAKEQHEAAARAARFEQVWKSRRKLGKASHDGAADDAMSELFHLYDVVRLDETEDRERTSQEEQAKRKAAVADGALLSIYLPLLRECLPDVAADLETDIASLHTEQTEDYVYDVYTVEENTSTNECDGESYHPTVQIVEDDEYDWREPKGSDYDSQDSNDENNPLNDYPDEDESGDNLEDTSSQSDDFEDFDPYASNEEEHDMEANNREEMQWCRRL